MKMMNNAVSFAIAASENLSSEASAVKDALVKAGLETPLVRNYLSRDQKYDRIREHMTAVLQTLGLDLKDDSLCETPHRIAKMYVDEVFGGLNYENFPRISAIENKMGVDEMVMIDAIETMSTCEHHFVTIDGTTKIAYVPGGKVIGLSKLNRLVRFFAQRPQVQERLNRQILVALQTLLETDDVAVAIDATHHCVKTRGVMDSSSFTRTLALGGKFKSDAVFRREFMS